MRVDLHGIDPWATRNPRRRDWLAAVLGALLLVAGGIAVWETAGEPSAVAANDAVDAADWQATAERSQRLNAVLADLSHPWSRWLERTVMLAGRDVRLDRLDGDPRNSRIEIVVTAPDRARGGAFVGALGALPDTTAARLTGDELASDGVRIRAEVTLR